MKHGTHYGLVDAKQLGHFCGLIELNINCMYECDEERPIAELAGGVLFCIYFEMIKEKKMMMDFGQAYAKWLEDHEKRRSGERRGRLVRGHGHAEQLFLQQVWWPAVGSLDHLHPEYEVVKFLTQILATEICAH